MYIDLYLLFNFYINISLHI